MVMRPLTTTVALLLAAVFLFGSVLGACGEERESGVAKPGTTQVAAGHGVACPVCPPCSGDHPQTCGGHCLSCPCHAPVGASPIAIAYSPSVSFIRAADPYILFPEVFLSRFVPPQNS